MCEGQRESTKSSHSLVVPLRYLKTTTVSVYTNLQPIVASFVAIAIGQDLLSWDKPVSLALVLLSAWIVTNSQQKG